MLVDFGFWNFRNKIKAVVKGFKNQDMYKFGHFSNLKIWTDSDYLEFWIIVLFGS